MARYYSDKKEEADNLKKIQVWWIKKHGYLNGWGNSGTIKWTSGWDKKESSVGIQTCIYGDDKYLRVYYTQTDLNGIKTDINCKYPIVVTPCNLGGQRYWFICSAYKSGVYCGKRVGTLYLADKIFACRHCYNLSYKSRNKSRGGEFFALFDTLDGYDDIEKLEQQIKRRYYQGKPTRKQKQLEKIQVRMMSNYNTLKKFGHL